LDTLMEEVNMLRKEEEEEEKGMGEYMDEMERADTMEMKDDEEEMMDMSDDREREAKALLSTLDGAGVEIGEPADRVVIDNGNPKASDLPVVKAFNNEELETLDLSVGNIEKAYEAFRQEQLEKLAYDNLQKQFEARFKAETTTRTDAIAKANYDAKSEIASLKEEFTQLRKSLTAEKETILKAQEESEIKLPSLDEVAQMDWNDIHKMVGGI
jgi:hypothetical protein